MKQPKGMITLTILHIHFSLTDVPSKIVFVIFLTCSCVGSWVCCLLSLGGSGDMFQFSWVGCERICTSLQQRFPLRALWCTPSGCKVSPLHHAWHKHLPFWHCWCTPCGYTVSHVLLLQTPSLTTWLVHPTWLQYVQVIFAPCPMQTPHITPWLVLPSALHVFLFTMNEANSFI